MRNPSAPPTEIARMHCHVAGKGLLLEVTVRDALTKHEVLEAWEKIAAHPVYEQAVAGLVIFGPEMSWNLSANEMADLGREVVRRLKPLHWAFVAPDALTFGMTRMFASRAEGEGKYQTFDSEVAARHWLQSVVPQE